VTWLGLALCGLWFLAILIYGGWLGWWLGRPTEPSKPRIRLKAPVVPPKPSAQGRAPRQAVPPKPPVTPAPAPMMLARGRVSIAADGSRIFVDGMGMVEVNDAELRRRAVRVVEQLVALARMQPAPSRTTPPLSRDEEVQLRELNWWHDLYDSKRRDMIEGCPGRTPPAKAEFDEIVGKIVEIEAGLPPHLRLQHYLRDES
jgi:hypothetical protein